jgi:methionyl-tRNA formyltransferase
MQSINDQPPPFQPDVIASVWYRHIIKQPVIDSVGGRIFNCHPSLLPHNRGCSAYTWSIIDGDKWSGVTYHYIDAGIDTGRIILQAAVQIDPNETQTSLEGKINQTAAAYFPAALILACAGWQGVDQQGQPTHHPRGAPYGGYISPLWDDARTDRYIRAMTRPPLPYARLGDVEIKTMADYHAAKTKTTGGNNGKQNN